MSRDVTIDVAADVNSQNTSSYNREASVTFTPLPAGKNASGIGKNKLFFALFSPSRWSLMKPTTETDPLGLRNHGSLPDDTWTFYWKVFGHYIPTSSGRVLFVLCAPEQNKFHVDVLKYKPLLKDARCRYCDESRLWWGKFDEVWKTAKDPRAGGALVNPDRWSYKDNREHFEEIVKNNPALAQAKDEAGKWTTGPRWVFSVFDISKYLGERPMDEGETQVDYQLYFAPKTIFDGLNTLYTNGNRFFNTDAPSLILLTKDCSQGSRNTKYGISNIGPWQIGQQEKAYLDDEKMLPDLAPGMFGQENSLVYILSYDEQARLGNLGPTPGQPAFVPQQQSQPQQQHAGLAPQQSVGNPTGLAPHQQQSPEQVYPTAPMTSRNFSVPDLAPHPTAQVPPQPQAGLAPSSGLVPVTSPPQQQPPAGAIPQRSRKGTNSW